MADYPIPPWLHGASAADLGQLAQTAQRSSMQFDMERQRMQQQQQMAEMELSAKQAAAEQAAMRHSQEIQIEKAYKDASLGLRQQELQQQEQRINSQIKVASQKAMAQATASRRIAAGEDPAKVWMEMGPMMGAPASSMASLAGHNPMGYGGAQSIEGLPEEMFKAVQTGPGTRAVVRLPQKFGEGSVGSIPVINPETGEAEEGVFAVPNSSGGVSIHNRPKKTAYEGVQAKLQAELGGGTNAPAVKKVSPMTSGKKTPTKGAIQFLMQHPDTADAFDAKYGKGSSAKILGTLSPRE